MKNIKVSLIQSSLFWENPQRNLEHFHEVIAKLPKTDLILLPEMFSTGFTMHSSRLAEQMEGPSMQWMHEQAEKKKAVICGSLIIQEGKKFYNRLIWMQANGQYVHYDKRHLFRMANENQYFDAGRKRIIVELKGWKICPLVCYDLRFPVFSRNTFETDKETYVEPAYDLLIFVANWPEARIQAWKKLLYARAIENQSYVVGLNRIGKDGKNISYNGNSMVIDAKGNSIWKAEDDAEASETITLSKKALDDFRLKFPVGMDADSFDLKA